MCPEAQFGEEFIYCFERNLVFFRFRTSKLFLRLHANHFWQSCGNAFYVSFEKFCEKTVFSRERICFFYKFWTLCQFSAIIPTFWGNRQNCTSIVEMHFEEIFFKKRFFVTLGQGAKSFGLLSKNFRQSFQTSFYVSAGNFWGIIYFSGKNRFFSIIFEYWVVLIWRTRHNCMLLVQIRFKIK